MLPLRPHLMNIESNSFRLASRLRHERMLDPAGRHGRSAIGAVLAQAPPAVHGHACHHTAPVETSTPAAPVDALHDGNAYTFSNASHTARRRRKSPADSPPALQTPAPAAPVQTADPFGEEITLTPKTGA